ncbi:unnamed protein product [Calypogeia fissa]
MVYPDPPLTRSRSRALASTTVAAAAAASPTPPVAAPPVNSQEALPPAPSAAAPASAAPAPSQDALLEKATRLLDLLYFNWIVPKATFIKLQGRPRSWRSVSIFQMQGDEMTDIEVLSGCIHPFEEVCDRCCFEGFLLRPSGGTQNDTKKRAKLIKWLWHHLGTQEDPDGLDSHLVHSRR